MSFYSVRTFVCQAPEAYRAARAIDVKAVGHLYSKDFEVSSAEIVVREIKLRQPSRSRRPLDENQASRENPARRSLPLTMNASRSPRRSTPRGAGASYQRVFPGSSFAALPSTNTSRSPRRSSVGSAGAQCSRPTESRCPATV